MVRALRLGWALAQIPHLAFSLFLFPLIISLLFVCMQLLATGAVLREMSAGPSMPKHTGEQQSERSLVRWMLYGSGDSRRAVTVCRWYEKGIDEESPPSNDCRPHRFDVTVQARDSHAADVSGYVRLFNGHVDRLHVCSHCRTDAVITIGEDGNLSSHAYSLWGLMILFLPYTNSDIEQQRHVVRRSVENVRALLGDVLLFIPEIRDGIGISTLKNSLPVVLNVSMVVLIALWLALKAHRKVLDYFSDNDVLLPLVSACGKNDFYSALWLLTLSRVGCFLVTAIPLAYLGLAGLIDGGLTKGLGASRGHWMLWGVALVATMALATVIASISELKHRHAFVSILYRFVPLLAASLGAVVWAASFFSQSEGVGFFRRVVAAVPVVGMVPIMVAPILNLPVFPLLVHSALAGLAFALILRRNARWFAAHLEEV